MSQNYAVSADKETGALQKPANFFDANKEAIQKQIPLSEIDEKINSETQERTEADEQLSVKITEEITARQNADTALQTKINGKADLVDGKVPDAQIPDTVSKYGSRVTFNYDIDTGDFHYEEWNNQGLDGRPWISSVLIDGFNDGTVGFNLYLDGRDFPHGWKIEVVNIGDFDPDSSVQCIWIYRYADQPSESEGVIQGGINTYQYNSFIHRFELVTEGASNNVYQKDYIDSSFATKNEVNVVESKANNALDGLDGKADLIDGKVPLAQTDNNVLRRINAEIAEPKKLHPYWESATNPTGYALTRSRESNSNVPAWKALDNDPDTFWSNDTFTVNNNKESDNCWIQIDLGSAKHLTHFLTRGRNDASSYQNPKRFSILGSNDNATFVNLGDYTLADQSGAANVQNEVADFSTPYRYYRLQIHERFGTTGVSMSLANLELWGYDTLPSVDVHAQLKKVATPGLPSDGANKDYVDKKIAAFISTEIVEVPDEETAQTLSAENPTNLYFVL